MPGGMGGMGGLMGGLMRGGMNQTPGAPTTAMQGTADVYDVDRWKRADDLDSGYTMVQAVRRDWEERSAEKGQFKRFWAKLTHKQPEPPAETVPEPCPKGGTIVAPEMKKASRRVNHLDAQDAESERPAEARQQEINLHSGSPAKNYLGLSFQTLLGGFFTANPVNSAILAVDTLALGPLALNQVTHGPETPQKPSEAREELSEKTGYMDELRAGREQRKYDVRIVP